MTGGYTMKEKNIRELAIRMGLITVEDMCQYTITQLVVKIANKVNELVNEVWRFETDVQEILKTQNENIQYLLGEGLHLEVENIFDGWLQDGTFDTLINQTALEKVNERIDETNAQLSHIYNVVESDVEDITNSINELLKDGDVKIPSGNYKISSTIVVPKNRNIVFSSGTKITVTGDFDVFELNNNVVINGNNSIIDCSIPCNTSSVFVIKGKYNFDIQNGTCSISNFKLIGNQSNVGLKFICEDTTKNGVKDEHIGWVYVSDINLTYFYKAIEMKVRTSNSGNIAWIN